MSAPRKPASPPEAICSAIGGSRAEDLTGAILDALSMAGWAFIRAGEEAAVYEPDLPAEVRDELEGCITGNVYADDAGTIMDAPLAVEMILDVLRRHGRGPELDALWPLVSEQMAHNLADEFGPEFTLANQAFAKAVVEEFLTSRAALGQGCRG